MSRGLAFGLVVSGAAYFGGYSPGYEGRLTGYFGDPNAAGYVLTTLGCLALGGMMTSRLRWPVGLVILLFIVLTLSRTSLLATALILVWMLIGSRVATLFGSILLGLMIYVVTNIPDSLRNFGPFEDRERQRRAADPDHRAGAGEDRGLALVRQRAGHQQGRGAG